MPEEILDALGTSPTPKALHTIVDALRLKRQQQGQTGTHTWLAAGGGAAILAAAITGGLALWRCTRVLVPLTDAAEDELRKHLGAGGQGKSRGRAYEDGQDATDNQGDQEVPDGRR